MKQFCVVFDSLRVTSHTKLKQTTTNPGNFATEPEQDNLPSEPEPGEFAAEPEEGNFAAELEQDNLPSEPEPDELLPNQKKATLPLTSMMPKKWKLKVPFFVVPKFQCTNCRHEENKLSPKQAKDMTPGKCPQPHHFIACSLHGNIRVSQTGPCSGMC